MKRKNITKILEIKKNDPLKEVKIYYIKGVNRMSDLIGSTKRDMENRVMIFISIILSGVIGALLAFKKFIPAILIFKFLLLLLLLSLIKEANDLNKLYEEERKLIDGAKSVGLDLSYKKLEEL